MLDVSTLISPQDVLGTGVQTLPPPPTANVSRFESIMNSGNLASEFTGDGSASLQDVPVLQVRHEDDGTVNTGQAVVGKVVEMDRSYQKMLEQFTNMPKFEEFMSSAPEESSSRMRTYPQVSSADSAQSWGKQLEKMMAGEQERSVAAMEYHGQLSHWMMNSQMLMSKIRIISAAVGQAADGFKTLFRAGG